MATNTNTIKTRVQLKSDTEANWKKSVLSTDHIDGEKTSGTSFVPLLGELIVFTSDDTHPFSRLKVGNGEQNVLALPFIDAGTLNGDVLPESTVVFYPDIDSFPSPSTPNKLYVDLSTGIIYCYTYSGGYTQLSNFTYSLEKTTVSSIAYWRAGSMTTLSCAGGTLSVTNGILPQLNYDNISVVRNITKEGTNV